MDRKMMGIVADEYQYRYVEYLKHIWPTMESNGFNEHNQTVNWIVAYEKVAKKSQEVITSWYEFQIPNEYDDKKRNNRIDGLIINHTKKEILLLESKRFCKNDVAKKRRKVGEDVIRIERLDLATRFNDFFCSELDVLGDYNVYGVVLFDLWTENDAEKEAFSIWKQICDETNVETIRSFLCIEDEEREYTQGLNECIGATQREVMCKRWEKKDYSYYLNTMVWKKQ